MTLHGTRVGNRVVESTHGSSGYVNVHYMPGVVPLGHYSIDSYGRAISVSAPCNGVTMEIKLPFGSVVSSEMVSALEQTHPDLAGLVRTRYRLVPE